MELLDIIVNSENHTTLETAVLQANLATTLSGDGPFTVLHLPTKLLTLFQLIC